MAFENLDIRENACFGRTPEEMKPGWVQAAEMSITEGWNKIDVEKLERDLQTNVANSYFKICEFDAEDLDTGILWHAEFNNDLGMWKASIAGSPEAEVTTEDADALFKSPAFIDFAMNAGQTIDKAMNIYNLVVDQHLENGDLLEVDEIKLARILFCIDLKWWMDNLRQGKYSL